MFQNAGIKYLKNQKLNFNLNYFSRFSAKSKESIKKTMVEYINYKVTNFSFMNYVL